jgi:acetyl-CoA carboxylase biotin carboxyl carrier protein
MELTDDDVRAILHLLDASAFNELNLETDEFRLTLRRASTGGWTQESTTLKPAAAAAASAAVTGTVGAAAVTQSAGPATAARAGAAASVSGAAASGAGTAATGIGVSGTGAASAAGVLPAGRTEVRTPLPGTFYRSPKPGAPPFVEVGSRVEPDSVIAIVETMKLMNSIQSGAAGRIVEICLADATFADQNTVLMRVQAETA